MIKMPGKEEASIFMERLKLDSREVGNQFYFSCMFVPAKWKLFLLLLYPRQGITSLNSNWWQSINVLQ